MSTLISDILKPRSNFPILDAQDVITSDKKTSLEDAIDPATEEDTGRIKVGDTIKNDNGKLSLDPFISIGEVTPTDNSPLWANPNVTTEEMESLKHHTLSTNYLEGINQIQVKSDGLYLKGYKGRVANVIYMNDVPVYAKSNIYCYINSSTGDDDTADGSADLPFKTWEVAKKYIPRDTWRYTTYIYFSGDFTSNTSSTGTTFDGFNGSVIITMQNTPVFKRLSFTACQRISIYESFKITIGTPDTTSRGCLDVYNSWVICTTNGSTAITNIITGSSTASSQDIRGIHAGQGGVFQATNSYITMQVNKCYRGVYADCCGEIDVRAITSSTNSYYGLGAYGGGVIRYSTKSNKATTATVTGSGGRIYTGSQSSAGSY